METVENVLRSQVSYAAPTPSKEPERIYTISVRQLDHGYMVEVGCKTFAIENATRLASLLSTYILAPSATHQLYFEGKLFDK